MTLESQVTTLDKRPVTSRPGALEEREPVTSKVDENDSRLVTHKSRVTCYDTGCKAGYALRTEQVQRASGTVAEARGDVKNR